MGMRQDEKRLYQTRIPDTEILSVSYEQGTVKVGGTVIQGLPSFYRIVLCARPGQGSQIFTEVWLPQEWNGIFLGLGNGGMAGTIQYPALARWICRGYAAANTDLGTSRGEESGIDNPDVWKNFGWRATWLMTESAKCLIASLYAREARYSYFLGCSTGGQQALAMAQRFPKAYDGILAGEPANDRICLHTYFLWNHRQLCQQGRSLFTREEIRQITAQAVAYFQGMGDGRSGDCFITRPTADEADIQGFMKFLAYHMPALGKRARKVLEAVYRGPVNPRTGERVFWGMPMGAESFGCGLWDCQQTRVPHFYPFIWAFGRGYDGSGFDFDHDLELLNQKLALDLNAVEPELSAFRENGGKLLMYSGTADPCVPYFSALSYYRQVQRKMGNAIRVQGFFRYFLFPGKDHGDTGPGTTSICTPSGGDILTALRQWREDGREPGFFIACGRPGAEPGQLMFPREIAPWGIDEL